MRLRALGLPPAPEIVQRGLSPAAGNRALARALPEAAASRTLARCPGCGGRCGGTCSAGKTELDEDLLATGQQALRRAVLARHRRTVSPRS